MAREFTTIGVVGLGTMGAGIAEVFARGGHAVVGVEQSTEDLERGRGHVQRSTDRAVKRGRLSEADQEALLGRFTFTTSMSDLKACDLVIEAVVERIEVKRSVFTQLDEIVGKSAVLATNTSSLSVTEIASATSQPGRVVGMHFFNPAPVQKLVEVITTVVSDPEVAEDVQALARGLGKNPVSARDKAGFIANALLFGYLNDACRMYESRFATGEDIDTAMRVACGYPMGPLALLDLIGLDTAYEILLTMYRQGRSRRHAPTPILQQMVTAGLLGRKTGRGFYAYDDTQRESADHPPMQRNISTVGVLGSDEVAAGITQAFTAAGYDVTERAGTTSAAGSAAMEGLADLAGVDLVVVAVGADPQAQRAAVSGLDGVCRSGTIIATASSTTPVVDIAAATSRPADVIGLHFFPSASDSGLVEVVSTVCTSPEVAQAARAVVAGLDKQPVSCRDRAGFVANALLLPYLNDAVKMLEAGYADVDDIDTAMKFGCALPKGPFEVLDSLGTDVVLDAQRALYRESREPSLAPAPLLQQLVTAGHLGQKSGRGFRDHDAT